MKKVKFTEDDIRHLAIDIVEHLIKQGFVKGIEAETPKLYSNELATKIVNNVDLLLTKEINDYRDCADDDGEDYTQKAERQMEQSAELRLAGINQDYYENGDPYDEGDRSYDEQYY